MGFVPALPPPLLGAGGLLALYLLGVLLAAVRPLLGLWGIAHLRRACTNDTDPRILSAAAECAELLGLKTPRLCRADVPVPMTWGWHRPVVLLPLTAGDWPEDRLRSVLLHEMAHIKRRDWAGHRFADFACAVYWFHPLVWLTARRLRFESELACDDLVLASGVAAPEYARHLLEIAGALSRASKPAQAAIAMAHTSKIEGRIRMILDKTHRRGLSRRTVFVALAFGGTILIPLATARPITKAQAVLVAAGGNTTLPNGVVVKLAGVTDTQSKRAWWSADGQQTVVALPVNTLVFPSLPPQSQGRAFAVQETYALAPQPQSAWATVPRAAEEYQQVQPGIYAHRPIETWEFVPNDHRALLDHYQPERPTGQTIVTQTSVIPLALSADTRTCQVSYGVAAGPWTEAVNCPKITGKTSIPDSAGDVIFTLIPNPHRLPAARAARGNAVFMVTDHFHNSSPRGSDNSTQTLLHDGTNLEREVYALDKSGRIVYEVGGGQVGNIDTNGQFKSERLASIPNSVLSRVTSFRLVARPYQWAQFQNVALDPVK